MQARLAGRWFLARTIVAATVCSMLALPARAQMRDTIPSAIYYAGVEQLYRGDYGDAVRTFNRALNGGVKSLGPNGQIRWIDSICYHTMLGETLYHAGQPAAALEQFNLACSLYLQNPRWMLRVQFDVQPATAAEAARRAANIPWGSSTRQSTPANVAETYPVAQGQIDNSAAVQGGGVVMQPQLWPVNVVEIVRCTALAIRRRNEILGPLGPFDSISKNLVLTLARGGAPPNHWSNAWIDLQRGFAAAGVADTAQAQQLLDSSLLLAGRFDHPLTGLALVELGRLALDSGDTDAAGEFLAEATYSAFLYEDAGVIDEAFRWASLAHIASGATDVQPALAQAAEWARRQRLNQIAARTNLALAEQFMLSGNWQNAPAALAAGVTQLRDARAGILANRAAFLEAKLEYHAGRESAAAKFDAAIGAQIGMSLVNLQIGLANSMFDAQSLPLRSAPEVYELLLADPTPADAIMRLLESIAAMETPQDNAFERWLIAVLDRGNMNAAIEVTDRAKRRRFHSSMPWGGRLGALRTLLAAPLAKLTPQQQQQRNDLLGRFDDFAASSAAAAEDRLELQKLWSREMNDEARRKTTSLWKSYTSAMHARELQLGDVGLSPVPAELTFPPLAIAAEIQAKLQPGQALLVYHDTSDGLLGFLYTSRSATSWNCGPSAQLGGLVSQFLRDLGNVDGNREMTTEALLANDWQKSSAAVAQRLLEGSSLSPEGVTELIVVPDSIVWYVPFEALIANVNGKKTPFVALTQVRYAPTVGLAFSFAGQWRRIQRTGIVVGDMGPGDTVEERAEAAATVTAAVPNPLPLEGSMPAPSPLIASLLDALIVLADVDANGTDPFAWAPLPIDRGGQAGTLDQWLAIAGDGPQRIMLPGMHTLAERGGKTSRRKGAPPPGSELFNASCALMSAGAETILLSRWRVGGQSTLDLVREFAQELPHAAAANAWKRSVQVAIESPIDPASEFRVKAGREPVDLTAQHPFFWAGYLVVDSGWAPAEAPAAANEAQAPPAAVPPAVAPPAAGPPAAGAAPAKPAAAPGGAAPANAPPAAPTPPQPSPTPTPPAAQP
jgi:hypothetical protein